MAVAIESSGTQTAVISTEHSLAAPTSAGVRALEVDTVNMVAGDILELRIKVAALSAGTQRVLYYQRYLDAQSADDLIKISVPIPSSQGATFTLKQTAGTGRNFPWAVLTL